MHTMEEGTIMMEATIYMDDGVGMVFSTHGPNAHTSIPTRALFAVLSVTPTTALGQAPSVVQIPGPIGGDANASRRSRSNTHN